MEKSPNNINHFILFAIGEAARSHTLIWEQTI